MKSKEALENVKIAPSFMGGNPRYWTCLESRLPFLEDIETIKQDLDRLEKLEKAIEILKSILIVEGYTSYDGSDVYFLCERNKFPVYTISLTKEQYESLKEVLGHEKENI